MSYDEKKDLSRELCKDEVKNMQIKIDVKKKMHVKVVPVMRVDQQSIKKERKITRQKYFRKMYTTLSS